MRAAHRVKLATALAGLATLGWMAACLDDPGGPEQRPPPAGIVVSDPAAASTAAVAPTPGLSMTAGADESVVYVSLVPATEPRGVTATARALSSDATVTTAMHDGGFDPVPIAAQVGDTIEVVVRDALGTVVLLARIAVARVRPPIVVRTDPPPKKRDVPLNSVMVVVFSEPIDASTLSATTLYVLKGETTLAGRLEFTDAEQLTAAFVPDAPLSPGTDYLLVVTQGIGDRDGDLLEAAVAVEFTTATVMATLAFVSVSTGGYFLVPPGSPPGALGHTCGVTTHGAAYCWGSNGNGRLGGSSTSSPDPVAVSGGLTFSALTAGTFHTCGLTTDGAAYCWGNGLELGHGSMASSSVPVAVAGGLTFSALSAAFQHTCGLTTNGAAYCWGLNSVGQLGNGSTSSNDSGMVPIAVTGGLTFTALSASGDHTCALAKNGAAYCWGSNSFGQLGDGTTSPSSAPVVVSGGLTFFALSASTAHTCGLTHNGAAYCWGWNSSGQLGDGTTTSSSVPVAVSGELTFSTLAPGGAPARGGHFPLSTHTCGVTTAGAAYCWGQNGYGQLGTGSTESSTGPIAVSGGLTFSALSASGVHTCGVATDGAAYCWGSNSNGQLGTGSTISSSLPVKVLGQP